MRNLHRLEIRDPEVWINGCGLGNKQPVVGAHSVGKVFRDKKVGTFSCGDHSSSRCRSA